MTISDVVHVGVTGEPKFPLTCSTKRNNVITGQNARIWFPSDKRSMAEILETKIGNQNSINKPKS